jgi:acyl-CoA ligase (AMP-forming) (exosortase A-associated)
MLTIHECLVREADRGPLRPALIHGHESLCYGALAELVARWRAALAAAGLERHARVAVCMEKRFDMVAALLATMSAGGIVVPVNPQLKPAQVGHILRDCDASILVTTRARLQTLRDQLLGPWPRIILCDGPAADPGVATLADLAAPGADAPSAVAAVIDHDPAAILYTSGSTGLPKGIVLSHRNLCAGAESVNAYLAHGADDVILSVLPLSFDAGLSQLTTAIAVGARLVLVNYLTAAEVAAVAARERATSLTAVPPLWRQLVAARWPEAARDRLRIFANTGGHMPRDLLARLRALFPHARPFLMYGLTEAFRSTYLDPAEVDRRPDSIGKAVPNAEVHVLRPDGTPAAPDEAGELVHRGACVTLGYWNRPDLTALRFRPFPRQPGQIPLADMAVWSGDLVRRDADGFLYFITRPEDMIKTSGFRVSPTEVEEAVLESGFVEEAVAFGAPHPELDHGIVVMAVARAGASLPALRAHCRRVMPGYMVPQAIVLCAALPRNPNGKLDRASLKTQHAGIFAPVIAPAANVAVQEV